jgi:hypothetical protein
MAQFPSDTTADGVWTLKQQRRAALGDDWPTYQSQDPYFGYVSLLLHGDGTDGSTTFTDSSSNNFTITANGDAQIDTAVKKFGTGSMQFDGSGDYLSAGSNAAYAFGTGDFTIELWFYRSGDQDDLDGLISTGTSAPNSTWQLGFGKASTGIGTNAALAFLIGGESNFTLNSGDLNNFQWYHAAATRSGSTVRLFVDGVLVDSGTNSDDLTEQLLRIAINRGGTNLVNCYIDDLRITKGVARSTANFTPPTSAFPDDGPPAPALLIEKKSYPATTTSGTFDFNTSLGGGSVSFTGHATYNNSSTWGPHQLFDNTRTSSDWCNLSGTSPLFGQWVFPQSVTITNIFVIPRSQGDNFPSTIEVVVDSVSNGTYNVGTLASGDGQQISYSGTGYNIQPAASGTTWRLNLSGSNAYIGEIEFWGY